MDDEATLFADSEVPDGVGRGPYTYGVYELSSVITGAIGEAFPGEVWVRGEVQGLARSKGREHRYFELVEKEAGANRIRATLSVALLSWNAKAVRADLATVPDFALADDIEVRIRGRIEYLGRFGRLSLQMTGIDPTFTVGRMALARERILARLAQAGLLDANGQLPVPVLPLDIGLVTSTASAAYRDFVHELGLSGFGFRVRVIDARVQGRGTDSSILQALRTFRSMPPDIVVIVRGGGSRADLAWFDSESLARAVASMPVPVFTGIGHEIDESVVDRVAHTAYKTPTAVAAALVHRVAACARRVEGAAARVRAAATTEVGHARARLEASTYEVRRARHALASAERQLNEKRARLQGAGGRAVHGARERLDASTARVRALDPARVLARGYSLTRRPDGHLVRSSAEVELGDRLATILATGSFTSVVQEVEPVDLEDDRSEGTSSQDPDTKPEG